MDSDLGTYLSKNRIVARKHGRRIPVQVETQEDSNLPIIYGITPMTGRYNQKADVMKLAQTLTLVENFYWIVVEDARMRKKHVYNFLKQFGLRYKYLNAKSPKSKTSATRGLEQRNAALAWLRKHLKRLKDKRGVVYFMDVDNTYSVKIFGEMRKIKRIGVWPVGINGVMRVDFPLVKNGKVIGFNAGWWGPFPIHIAGFAINANLFLKKPWAKFTRKKNGFGFTGSAIMKYFAHGNQLEPLADNCTKVYVVHTDTIK